MTSFLKIYFQRIFFFFGIELINFCILTPSDYRFFRKIRHIVFDIIETHMRNCNHCNISCVRGHIVTIKQYNFPLYFSFKSLKIQQYIISFLEVICQNISLDISKKLIAHFRLTLNLHGEGNRCISILSFEFLFQDYSDKARIRPSQ